ncbi:MAG: hypothetical protein ABR582_04205 [Gemmatimonadaceae bacterium]
MATIKRLTALLASVATMVVVSSTVATAQVGSGQPGVAALLSAINSADAEVKALNAQKNVSIHDIHLVSLAKIENPGNKPTIDRAIAKNAGPLGEMREHIGTVDAIAKSLAAGGVSVSQVVGLDVEPGGIYIFYQ